MLAAKTAYSLTLLFREKLEVSLTYGLAGVLSTVMLFDSLVKDDPAAQQALDEYHLIFTIINVRKVRLVA